MIFNDSEEYSRIPIVIIDEDNTDFSNEVVDDIKDNEFLKVINAGFDESSSLLLKNRIEAIYVIKKGFKSSISKENIRDIIDIYYLKDSLIATGISDIIASEILPLVGSVKAANKSEQIYIKNNMKNSNEIFMNSMAYYKNTWQEAKFSFPIDFNYKIPKNNNKDIKQINIDTIQKQSLIGLSIVFTSIYLIFSGATIIKERESEVFNRIIIAGYKFWQISTSNLIGIFTVGITLLSIQLIVFISYIEVESYYSILYSVLVYYSFIFCMSSLVLLFTSLFSNQIALQSFALPFVVFIALLGGAIFSTELLPRKAIFLSKLTPTYWGVDGLFKTLVIELSIKSVILNVMILFLMGMLFNFFNFIILRFKNKIV